MLLSIFLAGTFYLGKSNRDEKKFINATENYAKSTHPLSLSYGDSSINFCIFDINENEYSEQTFKENKLTVLFFSEILSKKLASYIKFLLDNSELRAHQIWCISKTMKKTEYDEFLITNNISGITLFNDFADSFRKSWGIECSCSSIILINNEKQIVFISKYIPQIDLFIDIINKNQIRVYHEN